MFDFFVLYSNNDFIINYSIAAACVESNALRRDSNGYDLANPIRYNAEYRKAESEVKDLDRGSDDGMGETEDDDATFKSSNDDESDSGDSTNDTEGIVHNDKYLIFTTGFKTYSPHQIGMFCAFVVVFQLVMGRVQLLIIY